MDGINISNLSLPNLLCKIQRLSMNAMEVKLWVLYCAVLLAGGWETDPVIHECLSGKRTVTEDTDVSFNCGSYSKTYQWYIASSSFIGYCVRTQCYNSLGDSFSLRATSVGPDQYRSQLTIRNISRSQAFELVCRDWKLGTRSTCKLRIKVPGLLVNGSCSLQLLSWYVRGNCKFTGMYDSDNNYTCVWRKNNDEVLTEVNDGEMYTALNGRQYVRGSCLYNQSIPTKSGTYRYSVRPFTGPVDLFTMNISITVPGQPSHDCPKIVPEGSDITCTCRSSVIGNPPAHIVWDGLNTKTLLLGNVRRENNSLVYTCRLTWGPDDAINRHVSYIVRVAYGPLAVFINKTVEASAHDSQIVRLTCKAFDVYPSATFTWNISCHNQTDNMYTSTCVFNLTQTEDNLVVTCTAHNKDFANVSSSYSYILRIEAGNVNAGLIGGVIAAVVGIIIVAVVVVYIIKRRKDPVNDTARRHRQNEHNYTDVTDTGTGSRQPTGQVYENVTRQKRNEGRCEDVSLGQHKDTRAADTIFDVQSTQQTTVFITQKTRL